MAISVQDDGLGMARSNLHCMLSFGFSSKEHVVGNVGRFGIGFKSGSMRLANDALILTRRDGEASAALLSITFLSAIDADDILIPMFTWKTEKGPGGRHSYVAHEPANTAEWEENMGVIEKYTHLPSEADVLAELDKIDTPTGTRIVLFNLKDPPEFDFSVANDIRMLGLTEDKERTSSRRPVYQQHRPGQQMTLDVPEDYSLRAYMEVLYLRPTVNFTLRGKAIEPRCPIERLELEYYQFDPYTPQGIPEERRTPVVVHYGYSTAGTKHCGFHIYNKNRLIRMYERYGAQLQANTMMKDMLGVIEADCLEPTHNKQAFNTTDIAYQKVQKHIEKTMHDYYFGVQELRLAGIGAGGQRRVTGIRKENKGQKKKGAKNGKGSGKEAEKAAANKRQKTNHPPKFKEVEAFPKILRKLMGHKDSWAFNEPVDAEYWGVLDYYEIIKTPMDFGTIVTKLDGGEYKTEGSSHGPQMFVSDVRQVFYNAWTYNQPEHVVYGYAQEVARLFENELRKVVGEDDQFGLLAGNVLAMCGADPAPRVTSLNGDGDTEPPANREVDPGEDPGDAANGGAIVVKGEAEGARKSARDGAASAVAAAADQEAIRALVETRAAQAIAAANAKVDDVLKLLKDERAERETFEAEVEATLAETIRAAREEERAKYAKLQSERETLLSALQDSSEMKKMYQDKVKAQEAEIAALRAKVEAVEAVNGEQ